MQPFVAHRSETQVDAGTVGSFATTWKGSECIATAGDATRWRFSVEGWAGGRALAYQPNDDQPVGTYHRQKAMSYDGELTFQGVRYEVSHSGRLTRTYLLLRSGTEVMSLQFKQGYVMGDSVQGAIDTDLDPGLALFFVWLVYVFRNENLWMASAPPALS